MLHERMRILDFKTARGEVKAREADELKNLERELSRSGAYMTEPKRQQTAATLLRVRDTIERKRLPNVPDYAYA